MSWRSTSFIVWAAVGLAVLGTQVTAIASRGRLPTADALFRGITSTRLGRAGLLVAWMWLGWHSFAR
ncbi:MAG TPA: DUF6186 family protein [Acidimicrobiales bacterium]